MELEQESLQLILIIAYKLECAENKLEELENLEDPDTVDKIELKNTKDKIKDLEAKKDGLLWYNEYYLDKYEDPNTTEIQTAGKGKQLRFKYDESLESTYKSKFNDPDGKKKIGIGGYTI